MKKPSKPVEKTPLEIAAMACCHRVYGAKCPCVNSPSVCPSMQSAALAAITAVDPELARRLINQAAS
jgi:hypothetical protein